MRKKMTIVIQEETGDEVAAVMIDWLGKRYGIDPKTLASAIAILRTDNKSSTQKEES